jgi:murein DD-endopeptidase MepM/ murein hydrolase activator NlpD
MRLLLSSLLVIASLPLADLPSAAQPEGPGPRAEAGKSKPAKKKPAGEKARKSESRKSEPGKKSSTKKSSAKKDSKKGPESRQSTAGKPETKKSEPAKSEPAKSTARKGSGAAKSSTTRLAEAVRRRGKSAEARPGRAPARPRLLGDVVGTPRLAHLSRLGATLAMPVAGVRPERLRDSYGEGRSGGRTHRAIDIHAPQGTPVVAVASGTIVKLHSGSLGGNAIYHLDEDGRTRYYYAHLERYAEGLREGQRVEQGEVIGYVGDTGNATPGDFHLHFSVVLLQDAKRWWDGVSLNPYQLLAGR